jgi:bifunctional N-acetylglucosamine-1-phosphate-uridyltransferase/glucosamine-1-phosphate-acetyltransferase GlmU-like protein
MPEEHLAVVVLAAGQGARMASSAKPESYARVGGHPPC